MKKLILSLIFGMFLLNLAFISAQECAEYGNGILTLNKNFTFTGLSQYIFMNRNCQLNINRGGSFG